MAGLGVGACGLKLKHLDLESPLRVAGRILKLRLIEALETRRNSYVTVQKPPDFLPKRRKHTVHRGTTRGHSHLEC